MTEQPTWQDAARACQMLERLARRLEAELPHLHGQDRQFAEAGALGARLLAADVAAGRVTPTWTTRTADTAASAAERAARGAA